MEPQPSLATLIDLPASLVFTDRGVNAAKIEQENQQFFQTASAAAWTMENPPTATAVAPVLYHQSPSLQQQQVAGNTTAELQQLGNYRYDSMRICTACREPIVDEFVSQVLGRAWHTNCLRCADCNERLQERCFTAAESLSAASRRLLEQQDASLENDDVTTLPPLYCRKDFRARFGSKCSRCGIIVEEGEMVRRAENFTYHTRCFCCIGCQTELTTGQLFYALSDGILLCKCHYDSTKEQLAKQNATNDYVGDDHSQGLPECLFQDGHGSVGLTGSGHSGSVSGADGPKRPRTTINSAQLELLRRAYEVSSKPARHIREQLSLDTGLDMRVVQVWFQNKRAKEKRMRKEPGSSISAMIDVSTSSSILRNAFSTSSSASPSAAMLSGTSYVSPTKAAKYNRGRSIRGSDRATGRRSKLDENVSSGQSDALTSDDDNEEIVDNDDDDQVVEENGDEDDESESAFDDL